MARLVTSVDDPDTDNQTMTGAVVRLERPFRFDTASPLAQLAESVLEGNRAAFERLLGDGSAFGVQFEYAVQPKPEGLAQAFHIGESFLDGAPAALVLGDNLFYGHELIKTLQSADQRTQGASIFGYPVAARARRSR